MFSQHIFIRCFVLGFAASLAASIVGCGSADGLGRRYSVYGTVTYKGEPVEKGVINFMPDDAKGRAAFSLIENGSYTLSTNGDRDGALSGKYKVTVVSKQVDMAKAEQLFKEKAKGKMENSIIPKDFMIKATKSAKNLVPARYSTPETSKLTAEVKEQSNSIPFELTD